MSRWCSLGVGALALLALTGCAAGGTDDLPAEPVEMSQFLQGEWDCDAVQGGEEFAISVLIGEAAMRFTSEVFPAPLETSYSLDGNTATTAEGWTIEAGSSFAPSVDDTFDLAVIDADERVWNLEGTRVGEDSADVELIYDVGGSNQDEIDLSCVRTAASGEAAGASTPDAEPSPVETLGTPLTPQEWCESLFGATDVPGFVERSGFEPYGERAISSVDNTDERSTMTVVCTGYGLIVTAGDLTDASYAPAIVSDWERIASFGTDATLAPTTVGGMDGLYMNDPGDATGSYATFFGARGLRVLSIDLIVPGKALPDNEVQSQFEQMVEYSDRLPLPAPWGGD